MEVSNDTTDYNIPYVSGMMYLRMRDYKTIPPEHDP